MVYRQKWRTKHKVQLKEIIVDTDIDHPTIMARPVASNGFPGCTISKVGSGHTNSHPHFVGSQKRERDSDNEYHVPHQTICGKCVSQRHTINYLRNYINKFQQNKEQRNEDIVRVECCLKSEITRHAETKAKMLELMEMKKGLEEKMIKTSRAMKEMEQKYNALQSTAQELLERNTYLKNICTEKQNTISQLEDEVSNNFVEHNDSNREPMMLTQVVSIISSDDGEKEDVKRIKDLMTKCRMIIEKQVNGILKEYNISIQKNLYHSIEKLNQISHISKEFIGILHEIRMIGNDCIHSNGKNIDRAHVTRLMMNYLRVSSECSENPWF